MKLKNIKTYTNALILTTVLLSVCTSQFPQYALSLFLTSLLALVAIVVLQWKFWRCPNPKCRRWLGLNLNITHCPRCRKKIDFEK